MLAKSCCRHALSAKFLRITVSQDVERVEKLIAENAVMTISHKSFSGCMAIVKL